MIEPRVSGIITAYNSEAFIAEAINSVLNQTHTVEEIVVVDDGSTDDTRKVVEQFVDKGVRYIYQKNSGAGVARNTGIKETSGDYIAFLDADDIWLENKTLLQANYLTTHPEIGLVSGFGRWWNVSKNTTRIFGKVPKDMKTLRREILVRNAIGNPSMVMVRRNAIVAAGLFDETIRLCAEFDMWNRIVARFDAAILPEPVTIYRWHSENLSNTYRWKRFYAYWNISKRSIKASQPAWLRPWFLARSWSNFTFDRAEYAIQSAFPRWRQVAYALAAFLVYPFDMTRQKLGAVVRSVFGDRMYQSGKRVFRSGMQARGQE